MKRFPMKLLRPLAASFEQKSIVIRNDAETDATAPPPTATASLPEKVSFNEHIQPILSEYCYHCHGPPPISPPSGPAQWLFQGPPAESKLLQHGKP